jgi:hypothetical protein
MAEVVFEEFNCNLAKWHPPAKQLADVDSGKHSQIYDSKPE